jgi:hypothetical protein
MLSLAHIIYFLIGAFIAFVFPNIFMIIKKYGVLRQIKSKTALGLTRYLTLNFHESWLDSSTFRHYLV